MQKPLPKTRQELFQRFVDIIDSDFVGIEDIEEYVLKLEAEGIEFIPTSLVPPTVTNPYAPAKKVT